MNFTKNLSPYGWRLVRLDEELELGDMCGCTGEWVLASRPGTIAKFGHVYYRRGNPAVDELLSLLEPATDDEILLVTMRARQIMGEGRREYGPLDLSNDSRTVEDFVREAHDEKEDASFYLDCAMIKMERERARQSVAKTPDGEWKRLVMGEHVPAPTPDDDPSPPSVGARERQS